MSSMLREVKVEDAVGMVLAHDLTQIIPGQFKGRLFQKGHVIREEDIPQLLNIGKEHIYILSLENGYIHEDEAANRLAGCILGKNVECTEPHEGKVTITSSISGLAKIDRDFVNAVNSLDQVILSTIPTNTAVKPKQALAGTRTIPLIIDEATVQQVERMALEMKRDHPDREIVSVKPFRRLRVGLITTGGEVFSGRIEDKFGPIVKRKAAELGSEIIEQRFAPDDSETIVQHIRYFEAQKADVILLTGGMSVDPDDRTPGAIKQAGARIVSYGTPMLPGSMLMMAYLGLDEIPVLGLPGCVMHDPYTSFDVLFPRICAGEIIERKDIAEMGYGGMLGC